MFKENFFGKRQDQPKQRTHYEILGVDPGADEDTIKKAYRALAKEYHPDANPDDPDAEEKFKEAAEAYSVLSDSEERRNYDSKLNIDSSNGETESASRERSAEDSSGHSENFRTKKEILHNISEQLKAELEELFKDPIRNREKIANFQEYASRRMDEALGFKRPTQETRTSASSASGSAKQRSSSFENSKAHELRIKRDRYHVTLVDEQGFTVGSIYENIERRGRYFIGENSIGFQYLIDPNTGRELSSGFKKIDIIGSIIIGTNSIDSQYLLDPSTGRELSSSYRKIIIRDGLVIGENSIGSQYLIDPKTGRELSGAYQKIEKRGGKIIGHTFIREEEIRFKNY